MHCGACSRSMVPERRRCRPHWISIGSCRRSRRIRSNTCYTISSRRTRSGNSRRSEPRRSRPQPAAWQVTLDVRARKVVVDEAGVETEVPMDDWWRSESLRGPGEAGKPLYLQKHRIRSGKQTITVTVPAEARRGRHRPRHLLPNSDGEILDNASVPAQFAFDRSLSLIAGALGLMVPIDIL